MLRVVGKNGTDVISVAGEHPAAMQHGGSCGVAPTILSATLTLVISKLLR